MSTIGIIGGGPAGLALAHDLCRSGHKICLYESATEFGGLARSFQFGDMRAERYYHFICADDTGYFRKLRELGLDDRLRWRPTKMGFYYNGQLYPFSSAFDLLKFDGISLPGRLRYGVLTLYCSLTKHWEHLDTTPAEQWLVRTLGREAYMTMWYPLLKVKFNHYHDQISAAWIWHRVHRVARSRRTPLHKEQLGYLEGGTDVLVDKIVAELQESNAALQAGQVVSRILIDRGRAVGLETTQGEKVYCDYVVSAIPLPIFLRITPDLPEEYAKELASIDFLGVVCLTLRLRHSLSENYWLNVNDPRVPFNGCIEYTNLNPDMTPDGTTILYVPYYLPRNHERFLQSEEHLLNECMEALQVLNLEFRPDWVIDCVVSRDPYAQVVCATGFAQRMPSHRTPVKNLFLIESSQLYPSDRTISGTIDLARNVAALIEEDQRSGAQH